MTEKRATGTSRNYLLLVDQYASYFDRPELRLRFLSRTLARQSERQETWHRRIGRLAFLEHTRIYRWLLDLQLFRAILTEFKLLLPEATRERRQIWREAPWNARLFFNLYRARHVLYFAGVGVAAASLFGIAVLIREGSSFYFRKTAVVSLSQANTAGTALAAPAGTAFLPDYQPEKVWMVEKAAGYERYSNGARILTTHETSNHLRAYLLFSKTAVEPVKPQVQRQPIGIVYHSSESDMLPFTADNSDSIQSIATGLRDYVRRHRSYNYLIDRCGEIHRIVKDEDAANHAGHSVWSDEKQVYVGLNESFIGVCFESTSATGALDEQLTEAQLVAGRALTGVLRSKYQISDANCTT
ncbi:MAG: peptidoglycan recognition family protein, partial [Acidobacteriota bacterium]